MLTLTADVEVNPNGVWVELHVWMGDRCVLSTEIDDELPLEERVEIAIRIAEGINRGNAQ